MMNQEEIGRAIDRLRGKATICAGVGILGCLVMGFIDSISFMHAYLYAWVLLLTLTLGCFGLTLLHHLNRSHWGKPMLRLLEAGGGPWMIAITGLLYIPILMRADLLYPWAQPDHWRRSEILTYRHGYMTVQGVSLRTFVYFAIWYLFALALRHWSVEQDRTGNIRLQQTRTNVAAVGTVILFITALPASTDWIMSLDIEWASTIFGIWLLVGSVLLALSVIAIIMVTWTRYEPYADAITHSPRKWWRDMTDLVLTLIMVWAYVALSQFLIQWSGNLPAEVGYYSIRGVGGWRNLSAVVIIGQFFIPFLCLLAPRTKNPKVLRTVCLWIILMRLLDIYWAIVPSYVTEQGNYFDPNIQFLAECVLTVLGLGGLWFFIFTRTLKSAALVPNHPIPLMDEEVPEHA